MSFCFVHNFSHFLFSSYSVGGITPRRQANQRRCHRRRFLFGDRRDSGPTSCQRQPSYVGRTPTAKDGVIMGRFGLKINKLMQALETQGEIYMLDRRQVWSDKLHKKVQSLTLSKSVPTEEYNRDNPKPKSTQHERVKVVELTTFSEVEIVLALAAKWKQVTRNGRRVKSNTC